MFDTNPANSLNAMMRTSGFKQCNWHHEFSVDELKQYSDVIEKCETCDAPVIWSCCNIELDPSPEAGGFSRMQGALFMNLPTNNAIEDELNKIVSEICCTPNLCWPTKLCGYCIEDVQKLTQLIAKQVKEARIDELEQMPSHTDINLHVRDRLAQLRSDCPTCPLTNGYHHFDCPTLYKENRESNLKSSTAEGNRTDV